MLCKNLFLLLAILSLLIKICTSWGGGLIKTKGGIVVFGDRMVQTHYDGLNQVMERLIRDPELAPGDATRILSEMANQHTLLPADDRNKRRIQQVAGKNDKQFTVSFVDDYGNTLDHFVKADKSGVDSLKSLANLLEQVHYDAAHEQARLMGNNKVTVKPHEFLVSDGKDIHGIEVGRTWGPNEKDNAEEGDPREPIITKKRGNVHVQGFIPGMQREYLNQHFGGRKPVKMDSADIEKHLINAFKETSNYVTNPNPVSASFHALFHDSKGKEVREFQHRDVEEEAKLQNNLKRSVDEVVEGLVRKKMWPKHFDFNQNNKWLYNTYWDAVTKIRREENNQGLDQRRSSVSSTGSGSLSLRASLNFNGRGNANVPATPNHYAGQKKKTFKEIKKASKAKFYSQ